MKNLLDILSQHLAVKFFTVGHYQDKPMIEIIMIDELDKDMKSLNRRVEFSTPIVDMTLDEMKARLLAERNSRPI